MVLDVEDPGRHLEDDPTDDKHQAQSLEQRRDRPPRRPDEQLGNDRPELCEHDRDERKAEHDVDALGHPVEPARRRHPVEEVEAEQPVVGVRVAAQPRFVRGVGEQPGQELDRDADQQDEPEHRRQPRPTHRALPSGPRERPILATGRRPEPAGCRRRRGRGPSPGSPAHGNPEPEAMFATIAQTACRSPRDIGNRMPNWACQAWSETYRSSNRDPRSHRARRSRQADMVGATAAACRIETGASVVAPPLPVR